MDNREERRGEGILQKMIAVELVEVAPFKTMAVRTGMTPDKSRTRVAWSTLTIRRPFLLPAIRISRP
jgi:hypothetical protein